MKTKDKLGEEVRKIRETLNLNQKEFAKKMRLSHVYISYIEQGKKIPSLDFFEDIYKLIGEENIPEKILKLLEQSKEEVKNKKINTHISNNYIYLIQEKGIFDYKGIKRLLEEKPKDLHLIHAYLVLLLREGKSKDAEEYLLETLKIIDKSEEKKWLQSCYYKLEGDFDLSISLILKSLEEFDKNYKTLTKELIIKKSHLLFQTASIYFEYAQSLYNKGNISESINNFKISANYHKKTRDIYQNPSYQMDFASIYFWLAFLGENKKENWLNYIKEAKEAIKLNYYEGLNNRPSKSWNSVYSKPYILATMSFIARSYGELALLEEDNNKKEEYLSIGEDYFIKSIPLELNHHFFEYYRFYFNHACFYSIKAEIKASNQQDYSNDLEICFKSLKESYKADAANVFKLLKKELEAKEGLDFFKKERKNLLTDLIKEITKKG